MSGLVLTLALLVALSVVGARAWRRRRRRLALAALPGGSRATALEVEAFSEIEEDLGRRQCACGGRLASHGERSENDGERILRVVAIECGRCEERGHVWFDATRAYH